MTEIKAVLFDLGDTLWHYPNYPPIQEVRQETSKRIHALLRSWGIEPEGDLRYLGREIRLAVDRETHRAFYGDSISPHYPGLCRIAAANMKLELTEAQSDELWETWNLEGQFYRRELFEDVLHTLEWLKQKGYRIGSVTNRGYSGPRFWRELEELGLAGFLETVVTSCDTGYLKPHPKIFQKALADMKLAADETAMVGDSMHADVKGAQAMGMTAIWRKPPYGEPVETGTDSPDTEAGAVPDYTLDHVSDLTKLPIFNLTS